MARKAPRPEPTFTQHLDALYQDCPACHRRMWSDYRNDRTVVTLLGLTRLVLHIRRCHTADCPRHLQPYRPEAEGRHALPQHEFGLDVIAHLGALRYAEHRSVPEIHQHLVARGLAIAERTVTNLLERYDELLAVTLTDAGRLRGLLAAQGRVILAIDGLQPDVGHEVLWVLRDCLSGTVLLRAACCPAGSRTWPNSSARCATAWRCRSPGWSPTASTPSARPWPKPCPACRTNSATSTTSAKPPGPSTRPTATPRRNSRSASAACGPSSARWRAAPTPRPRPSRGTATRSAVP